MTFSADTDTLLNQDYMGAGKLWRYVYTTCTSEEAGDTFIVDILMRKSYIDIFLYDVHLQQLNRSNDYKEIIYLIKVVDKKRN